MTTVTRTCENCHGSGLVTTAGGGVCERCLGDGVADYERKPTMSEPTLEDLKNEHFHLRAALLRLADAAEEFYSSDPDMPSYRESEAAFDEALEAARIVLASTDHDERPKE